MVHKKPELELCAQRLQRRRVTTAVLLAAALAALGLGLGLIVAIGAQNAFVLRQGIRREHVLAVVLVCSASDAVLIVTGVAGAGALFTAVPWLVTVARWGGALFVCSYAALAARRTLRGATVDAGGLRVDPEPVDRAARDEETAAVVAGAPGGSPGGPARTPPTRRRWRWRRPAGSVGAPASIRLLPVIGTASALTWLNPHVYLDTVVLLGSVGSSHAQARWAFAAGAVVASTLWFSALGLAARLLAPVFARPSAWRVLDGIIAAMMTAVAACLLLGG
jgi:L-lysine exporter family protein LysE/ArgO